MAFIVTGIYIAALFGVALGFIYRHGRQANAAGANQREQTAAQDQRHSKVPA